MGSSWSRVTDMKPPDPSSEVFPSKVDRWLARAPGLTLEGERVRRSAPSEFSPAT
jgi:hypothetical protein